MFKLILACALLGQLEVVSERDSGPGSFRAAVERAQRDPFKNDIVFDNSVKVITLTSPIVYESSLPLYIHGPIEILTGSKISTVLTFKSCSNISLNNIRLIGGGIFIDKSRNDKLETIFSLNNILIRDSAGLGLKGSDFSKKKLTINANNLSIIRSSSAGCYVHKNGADMEINLNYCIVENCGKGGGNGDGFQACQSGGGGLKVKGYMSDFYDCNEDGGEFELYGEGDLIVDLLFCNFFDNGEENLECNSTGKGNAYINLDYVIAEGYDEHDNDRNDCIEVMKNGEGTLLLNLYMCQANNSENDGLRIIYGGLGDAIVYIESCLFTNNLDEGIDLGSREGMDFRGLVGLFVYDSIIKHNFGNGIKAVAPNGGLMEIYGQQSNYKNNFMGNLDLENSNWTWLNSFARELD